MAVLVSVMIVAALAAVALPIVSGASDYTNAQRTARILRSLDTSLIKSTAQDVAGQKGFCSQVAKCPQRLFHLTHQLNTTLLRCSGAVYTTTDSSNWATSPLRPYSGLPIVKDRGVLTPYGWIHDSVLKRTDTTTRADLHLDSLTFDQVNYLDLALDPSANATVGRLQYAEQTAIFTATGQHRYLASYRLTITASWCT